jgi:MULE transposase domain/SWIM zinc finger
VNFEALRQYVDAVNIEMRTASDAVGSGSQTGNENFIAISETDDALIIAVCTPMMKRVHRMLKHSGELVFVDAGGNMDRQNTRVFLLLTHSAAGGLPLGVLLVSNEQCGTVTAALRLYMTLLDDGCFGGRGSSGPAMFMTDDSAAERNALKAVFPDSVLLLCAFHILQAFWRFLWDSKTNVKKDARQQLFMLLKSMLYANSTEQLETLFNKAISDTTLSNHPKVLSHLQSLYSRRLEWALCCRSDLPVRGNHTNNFCESAMRVMKDKILQRTKAFNVQQLIDFIVTRLESHYQRRLIDAANNRLDVKQRSRFVATTSNIDAAAIRKLDDDVYEVPSEKSEGVVYSVDMSAGCCSCPIGKTGGPCKHQSAVLLAFKVTSWNFLPVTDTDMRQVFHVIATGDKTAPAVWFASLSDDSASATVPSGSRPIADALQSTTQLECTTSDCDEEPMDTSYDSKLPPNPSQLTPIPDPDVLTKLSSAFAKIENLYRADPLTYGSAIESFCHHTVMSSNSALQSALHCFGKYSGAATALGSRKKFVSLKTIGVQPTALARRKIAVGGRKLCYLGRPPRSAFSAEHGYAVRNCGEKRHVLPKPKKRAPHNLAEAVSNVQALGGTHSAK